ncbi:phage terminase small subunit P27 family [Reyranella soli]|nr:phage terminase small subunit P27 family [Reyranella soli]
MPRALKVLRGTSKKKLPVEPEGRGDLWDPPSYFDAAQKKEWSRVIENAPYGILTGTDRDAVAAYVVAVVEYAKAVRAVRKDGQLMTAKNGTPFQNPSLGIANRQALLISRLCASLGFNPTSRASLGTSESSFNGSAPGSLADFTAKRPKPGSLAEYEAERPDFDN